MTGGILNEDVLLDVLAGDLLGAFGAKGRELRVLGGQRANALGNVHEHVGAVDAEATLARRGDVLGRHNRGQRLLARFAVGVLVGRLRAILLVALDHNCLEVLAATHCARAIAAGGAVIDIEPAGKAHEVLAGAANRHAVAIGAVALLENGKRFVDVLAPQVRSIIQGHIAVFHIGIDGLVGPALENETVKAGPLKLGRCPAAHVRVCNGAREGRLCDDGKTAAHVDIRTRERAIHDAQQIFRRERLNFRAVIKDILDAQPARANVLARIRFVDTAIFDVAAGQIDPGNTVGKSSNGH